MQQPVSGTTPRQDSTPVSGDIGSSGAGQGAPRVVIRDVTLRDGLQLTGKLLSTDRKVSIIREMLRLGVPSIEIGSLARPDVVPAMANTIDVARLLTPRELDSCWVWVATLKHVVRASEAGVRNVQYCFSVSDSHNRANIGRDTDVSIAAMPEALSVSRDAGGRFQMCLATAFTCPFEGPIQPERVISIVEDPRARSVEEIVLCDTLGQAHPAEVASLVARVRAARPDVRIAFHAHDTWGQGVANTMVAVAAGAEMVDGALGGLGGCPFAPGASGNAATEDLVFALRPEWVTPPALVGLAELSGGILAELAEPNRSRAVEGVRSSAPEFPWTAAHQHR